MAYQGHIDNMVRNDFDHSKKRDENKSKAKIGQKKGSKTDPRYLTSTL